MKTIRKRSLIFLVFLIALSLLVSAVHASDWVVVTSFTGAASEDTAYFTCTHTEWQIIWNYTPEVGYEQYAVFGFFAYDTSNNTVSYVDQTGNTTTSGNTYVHNDAGTFYFSVVAANLVSYNITVLQDLDSLPEYPLISATLFIVMGFTFVIVMCKKRLKADHTCSLRRNVNAYIQISKIE